MENTQAHRFFNRGPSPAARLTFVALLSLLLLFIDARYQYLESVRTVLSVLMQPVRQLATMPAAAWRGAGELLTSQRNLLQENARLRQQHSQDAAQLGQFQSLQLENQQLRSLMDVRQRASYPMQLAEIVYVERDIFKRKVFVNKGAQAHIQAGQVVADDRGVVGQVTRIYPWLSEVTLITDKDHPVPVQVLRNGLRSVVFGSGDTSELSLRYMPISSDIQTGDVLVTSGIDGTYPPDLPVARVDKIERDPAYPFARIRCTPLAGVDRQRYLLILAGVPKLPELPEAPAEENPADKSRKAKRRN